MKNYSILMASFLNVQFIIILFIIINTTIPKLYNQQCFLRFGRLEFVYNYKLFSIERLQELFHFLRFYLLFYFSKPIIIITINNFSGCSRLLVQYLCFYKFSLFLCSVSQCIAGHLVSLFLFFKLLDFTKYLFKFFFKLTQFVGVHLYFYLFI